VRDLARQLELLRERRVPPEPDLSIAGLVADQARYAQQTRAQLGQLIDLWFQVVPADLRERTSICSLRRGVLTVEADSAAVRFELDRLLREGLTDQLRRHFRGSLQRIRVRLASGPAERRVSPPAAGKHETAN